MGENSSNFKGKDLPVENITWYDAINYCNKLSEKMGLDPVYIIYGENVSFDKSKNGYRLPTEAEWEYAARAGTTTVFNTENSIDADMANFYGHYPYGIEENYFTQENLTAKPGTYRQTTTKVGSFSPNKWGLYDIHGNVREWCFDYYGEYDLQNTNNPTGANEGTLKVNRGGSWNDYAKHMRSAYRGTYEPGKAINNTGFRIVRNGERAENTGIAQSTQKVQINRQYDKDKTLIVYFSWNGNTENAAKIIHEQTGADIVELELVHPYTTSYNKVLDDSQKDLNNGTRPELKTKIDNIEEYDTIFLGYPNWWADMPMPLYTFLDEYDLSGKRVAPFITHGGSGLSGTPNKIKQEEPNATVTEGLAISGSAASSSKNTVQNWLSKIGF